jgi:hypothetical protein
MHVLMHPRHQLVPDDLDKWVVASEFTRARRDVNASNHDGHHRRDVSGSHQVVEDGRGRHATTVGFAIKEHQQSAWLTVGDILWRGVDPYTPFLAQLRTAQRKVLHKTIGGTRLWRTPGI